MNNEFTLKTLVKVLNEKTFIAVFSKKGRFFYSGSSGYIKNHIESYKRSYFMNTEIKNIEVGKTDSDATIITI